MLSASSQGVLPDARSIGAFALPPRLESAGDSMLLQDLHLVLMQDMLSQLGSPYIPLRLSRHGLCNFDVGF